MKAILIIFAVLSMTGCKTYNITFQEMKYNPIDTVYMPKKGNRFTKQFHEAAKSALESTKHLRP